jgi:serine phosphatase RsbU (regulator of sigma subunit)
MFKPRDIVSGDFYWFARQNGKILLAAVDCTGHGVPGAFMSLIGNNLLNDIVLTQQVHDTSLVLQKLHEGVVLALHKEALDTGTVDGMDIALCSIDQGHNRLEFSSTGRPIIMVRQGQIKTFRIGRHPIGLVTKKERKFEKLTMELNKNDLVYIFTDGYCDQFGGPKAEKFMYERFEKLLAEISNMPLNEQEKILEQRIEEWKGENQQLDDILVIGVRP